MDKLKLDADIEFESEHGIKIGKYIKVEKGAVYNDQGYVTVNNYPDEHEGSQSANDDDAIHNAITELHAAVDNKGNKIFTEQGQWYAVYRVLREYCNYPEQMTDFSNLINKKKWAEEKPYCKYESIASVSKNMPKLSLKVSLWQQYSSINEKYSKQCVIAEKMLKLLDII